MAYDKIVDSAKLDADLTMVADAIRDTGVTDEQIAFPDGYVDMVNAAHANLLDVIQRTNKEFNYVFPKGIKSIGRYAYSECSYWIFPAIPEGVTSIEYRAFQNNYRTTEFVFPSTLNVLGETVLNGCKYTTTVTFKGKPSQIHSKALQGDSIATINVPWAEGEVANAPWGATNATINYNYTGEG